MSIKHVKKYYHQIQSQYAQMVVYLKEFEKEASDGLIEPERVESVKKSVQVMKDNYERWAYMMYLLYTPNRKEKAAKFRNMVRMDEQVPHKNTADWILEENNKVLHDLKENKNLLNYIGDEDDDD